MKGLYFFSCEIVVSSICPVYAYEGEENILCDPVLNASATMLGQSYVFTKAEYVKADTQIETAGFQVEIIPTPGHTEGGCCYYIGEEHVLFSGDTLFPIFQSFPFTY